ncbi:MAG: nucleotide sugar dehydrogenase, partial [Verrucomicrobiae bacterium]|nr:nucleotide sugar dehydrogenase [Verrucomicrobiae bacterium]
AEWSGTRSVSWDEATLQKFDAVIIATNHASVDYSQLAGWVGCIVDTRNAMNGVEPSKAKVWKA